MCHGEPAKTPPSSPWAVSPVSAHSDFRVAAFERFKSHSVGVTKGELARPTPTVTVRHFRPRWSGRLSARTVPVERRVVNRWWMVGAAAAIAAAACSGDGDSDQDQPECEVGTEACPCYRDDSCDDGLVCLSDLCVFDPDAPPSGTGGRRGSGGNSSSPGIGGDGEVPVAGDGPGAGPGGTG